MVRRNFILGTLVIIVKFTLLVFIMAFESFTTLLI